MLRSVIQSNHNVNMANYKKLIAYLKKISVGYKPKQAKVFDPVDLRRFLVEADDDEHLLAKVVLVFGVFGAPRVDELTKLMVGHVREKDDLFLVDIPHDNKTEADRFFVIEAYGDYVRRYRQLRPKNVPHDRFFLNYQKGKCTIQPVARNKFLGLPKLIAEFLQLDNPHTYTGHSFRRTSATMLANSGGDLLTLKRHGGWRSNAVVERYIDDSVNIKRKICDQINDQIPVDGSNAIAKRRSIEETTDGKSDGSTNAMTVGVEATEAFSGISDVDKAMKIVTGMKIRARNDVTINFNFGK